MRKSNLQNVRNELQRRLQQEAHLRVEVENRVKLSQKYATLHFGLKLNHERNVAVVHPLMFLLRRIIYAITIIFLAQETVFGVLVVMASCLIMLAYALTEWQWKEPLINCQHIGDEITIYIICLMLLLFSGFVESAMRNIVGWALIGLCVAYVVFNTIVSVCYSLRLLKLLVKRQIMLAKHKSSTVKTSSKQGVYMVDMVGNAFEVAKDESINKNMEMDVLRQTELEQPWFTPDDIKGQVYTNGLQVKQRIHAEQQIVEMTETHQVV